MLQPTTIASASGASSASRGVRTGPDRIQTASTAPISSSGSRDGVDQYAASGPNHQPMIGASTENSAASATTGPSTDRPRRADHRHNASRVTGHNR